MPISWKHHEPVHVASMTWALSGLPRFFCTSKVIMYTNAVQSVS